VLTPQTHELFTLVRCECASASVPGVDLGALHPFAQCVLADVEITRDATDGAIPDLAEPNSLCFELGREGTTLGAWPDSMLCP